MIAADIANAPVAGIDAALQGKVAGVQVMQNSGNPGNGISVRVRGPASLNAGNQPLYVVDGVPIIQENYSQLGLGGQDMTAVTGINPDEIETIDVLKDAAAAAIYGSRGSNGVVHDHDQARRAGQDAHHVQRLRRHAVGVEHTIGRCSNAKQYVEVMNESAKNDGYDPTTTTSRRAWTTAATYDWQKAVFRNAPVRDAAARR